MARQLTKQGFAAPSAGVVEAIDAEDKLNQLRQANFEYETKRRDLEQKFEAALSQLREGYLSQVLAIHNGEEAGE
jgi:hypothetical protein